MCVAIDNGSAVTWHVLRSELNRPLGNCRHTEAIKHINFPVRILCWATNFLKYPVLRCAHSGRDGELSRAPVDTLTGNTSGSSHRKRRSSQNDDIDNKRSRKHQVSSKYTASSNTNGRMLACPFHKKDPRQHWRCAGFTFRKISYVKQHIYRNHQQPPFCTICGNAFEDGQSRDRHITSGCRPQPFSEPDGITLQHRNALSQRSGSHLTIEAQWYAVFDIVCPGHPRPMSPYHDFEVSCSALTDLREFVTGDTGTETVYTSLRRRSDWRPEDEAAWREPLSSGLGDLVDRWATFRATAMVPSAQEGHLNDMLAVSGSAPPFALPSIESDQPSEPDSSQVTASSAAPPFSWPNSVGERTSFALMTRQTPTAMQPSGEVDVPPQLRSTDSSHANNSVSHSESELETENLDFSMLPINNGSWPDLIANLGLDRPQYQ